MRVINHLSHLIEGLQSWKARPTLKEFESVYYRHMKKHVEETFGSAAEMYELLSDLDWNVYRESTLLLDPAREEARARQHLSDVQNLLDVKLQGEIILFGSFETMDGYARFDRGSHRVFLGVDESHGRGRYLDVLETHEITHVARESREAVWTGWGLDPKMTHDQFTEVQPTIEHLFGEGFSCAVSEWLVPGEDPWHYAYQEKVSLAFVLKNARALDEVIHQELLKGHDSDWGRLYSPATYTPRLPVFSHYVWAWKWVSQVILDLGKGHPKNLLSICSKEFMDHALEFRLDNYFLKLTHE